MIDYLSYPLSSLRRVVHPGQQVVGHKHNNKGWAIPEALIRRYHRPGNPHTNSPEWWLPPDDPQWDELITYPEALRLYEKEFKFDRVYPAKPKGPTANEVFWSRVRALPGGSDPLWKYGSQSPEDTDDLRFMLRDDSRPNRKPWFPRVQLRLKYGTTDILEYASKLGVVRDTGAEEA